MSKRHKRNRHHQQQQQFQHQPQAAASTQSVSSAPSHGGNLPEVRQEMKNLKTDMWHLAAVNAFLLAGLLVLYYTNQSSGYLNRWLANFIKL